MWIKNLRQFLDRSLQHFAGWLRSLQGLPTRLFHREAIESSLPLLDGFGPGSVKYSQDPESGRWHADLSYQYRSLTCSLRVSPLEPLPGMQHIYTALRGTDEG
jgi:hypothetical protein